MEFTVTTNSLEEARSLLAALGAAPKAAAAPAPAPAAPRPAAASTAVAKAAPAKAAPAPAKATSPAASAGENTLLEKAKALGVELVNKGRAADVKAALVQLGAAKVSALSGDQIQEFLDLIGDQIDAEDELV